MAASFSLPEGYWTTASRDEFNTPCVALHHKDAGWLSDHDCEAEAIYAAQDREVEADEAAEAAEAEDLRR
jgi:hypothetical protein